MMILVPLSGLFSGSPWLTVLLVGTLAVAWFMLLAAWLYLDADARGWM